MIKKPKKPKWLDELKQFALRGNVMDLAVGVMVGGAFQAIVNSFVKDIVSPVIGLFGNVDFSNFTWTMKGEGETAVVLKYGAFITAVINFAIMVCVIFFIIKLINTLTSLGKKKVEEEEPAPTTKKCPFCCSEIAIEATRCPHCTSVLEETKE